MQNFNRQLSIFLKLFVSFKIQLCILEELKADNKIEKKNKIKIHESQPLFA